MSKGQGPRSYEKCDSPLRRKPGKRCRQPSGNRTDHPGQGRCWLHAGRPPTHGRYSTIANARIRELSEQLATETEAEQLNIFPELRHTRALYQDFIERYDAYTAALLSWHESWRGSEGPYRRAMDQFREAAKGQDVTAANAALTRIEELEQAGNLGSKPHQVLDIADAYRILSEVTKIVERIERIRNRDRETYFLTHEQARLFRDSIVMMLSEEVTALCVAHGLDAAVGRDLFARVARRMQAQVMARQLEHSSVVVGRETNHERE